MFSGEAQPSTTNRPRGELKKSESRISKRKQQVTKPLNIGLIGCGFMGRAHSNAYRKVNNFFDLAYRPVLKAVCARNAAKVKAFADKWGYESVESDWRKLIDRK